MRGDLSLGACGASARGSDTKPTSRTRRAPSAVYYALSDCEAIAGALLKQHGLSAPNGTLLMLAKTIRGCRVLGPRANRQRGEKHTPRERLAKARRHARKLLEYAKRPPPRRSSIATRSESLYCALNHLDTFVRLAVSTPPIDVASILERLDAGPLLAGDLKQLLQALDHELSAPGMRTGRPIERHATVVRAGCIAWIRSGQTASYSWNAEKRRCGGRLASFVRHLLECCDLKLKEAGLYPALGAAVRQMQKLIEPSAPRGVQRRLDPTAEALRRWLGAPAKT